jgi:hypothetical protein
MERATQPPTKKPASAQKRTALHDAPGGTAALSAVECADLAREYAEVLTARGGARSDRAFGLWEAFFREREHLLRRRRAGDVGGAPRGGDGRSCSPWTDPVVVRGHHPSPVGQCERGWPRDAGGARQGGDGRPRALRSDAPVVVLGQHPSPLGRRDRSRAHDARRAHRRRPRRRSAPRAQIALLVVRRHPLPVGLRHRGHARDARGAHGGGERRSGAAGRADPVVVRVDDGERQVRRWGTEGFIFPIR